MKPDPMSSVVPAPKAILFDLDGTLLDTAADLHRALNDVLTTHRRQTISLEQARPVASHGARGLLRLGFGEDFSAQSAETLREAFLSAYRDDPFSQTTYFSGVDELLGALTERRIAYGIVTNKPTEFTQALLPHFARLADNPAVVCGDTLAVAKPDPAPLQHAAGLLNVDAADCWYVGDAERDIIAGRNAGMYTILAAYGYIADNDDIASWAADASIEHALELLNLLPQT